MNEIPCIRDTNMNFRKHAFKATVGIFRFCKKYDMRRLPNLNKYKNIFLVGPAHPFIRTMFEMKDIVNACC